MLGWGRGPGLSWCPEGGSHSAGTCREAATFSHSAGGYRAPAVWSVVFQALDGYVSTLRRSRLGWRLEQETDTETEHGEARGTLNQAAGSGDQHRKLHGGMVVGATET